MDTRTAARRWAETWQRCWMAGDADSIAALYAAGARYSTAPFREPYIGPEGALAYLGLSVEAPTPTWGKMIFAGKDRLQEAWWISMMPALVLFLTILSINLIGDVLAEKFNVRDAIG